MKKYTNVISLGFFCSTASEIERIGLRNASYPFDWVISEFDLVLNLIENNFSDFLEEDLLIKDKNSKPLEKTYVVKNVKNNIRFFHDFFIGETISKQISVVKEKYNRRIKRFYKSITKPTLFIRYIKDNNEINYIINNFKQINKILKYYNENNDIIFICNSEIYDDRIKEMYNVKKDKKDTVARKFLKKNNKMKRYILKNVEYNRKERFIQILKFQKKELEKRLI